MRCGQGQGLPNSDLSISSDIAEHVEADKLARWKTLIEKGPLQLETIQGCGRSGRRESKLRDTRTVNHRVVC